MLSYAPMSLFCARCELRVESSLADKLNKFGVLNLLSNIVIPKHLDEISLNQ